MDLDHSVVDSFHAFALIMAGSYNNEAIVIFLLIFTVFCWIKALKQGSALFSTIAAVYWFHMVAAWHSVRSVALVIYTVPEPF